MRKIFFGTQKFQWFAGNVQQRHPFTGCSKWLSSKAAASEGLRRILEALNGARTPVADIFSILLERSQASGRFRLLSI
jgi:hypothetical protein